MATKNSDPVINWLEELDPIARSAIVNFREFDLAISLKNVRLKRRLGNYIVHCTGLMLMQCLGESLQPPLLSYREEWLSEGYEYTLGYARVVVDLGSGQVPDATTREKTENFRNSMRSWFDVARRIGDDGGSSPSNKCLIGMEKEISICLESLVDDARPLWDDLWKRTVPSRRLSDDGVWFTGPYMTAFQVEGGGPLVLFGFKSLAHNEAEGHTRWIFSNLPTGRIHQVVVPRKPEPGESMFAKALRPLSKRFAAIHRSRQQGERGRTVLPILADIQPQLMELANFLLEETVPATWESLWTRKLRNSELKQYKSLDEESRAGWLLQKRDHIREIIVLECVERDPVLVLLEVAQQEGEEELSGYLEKLSPDRKQEIIHRALEISGLKSDDDGQVRDLKKRLYQRLLAIEVARLNGITVSEYGLLKGIRFCIKEAELFLEQARKVPSFAELRLLVDRTAMLLEEVLRDLMLVYRYVHPANERYLSVWKPGEPMPTAWRREVETVNGLPLGPLYKRAKELLQDPALIAVLADRIGIDNSLVNSEHWASITGENTDDYIMHIRNAFPHQKYDIGAPERNTLLIRAVRREDTAAARPFIEEMIKRTIQFFFHLAGLESEDRPRVFPYKLTFAVDSRTAHGMRYCHYYTDAVDEETTRDTLVYTDPAEKIDLGQVYFCLPNWRLRHQIIWVKPILVPAMALRLPATM